jgi:hypothetical protein
MSGRGVVSVAMLVAATAVGTHLAAQAVTEGVHVVITGGSMAGTYDATETKGGCSTGATGPGSWGNAFSNIIATEKQIGQVTLVVPDARAATSAAGSKEFSLELRLGSIAGTNVVYDIETRSGKKPAGSGTVTVADAGSTAKVTINAKTADGVGIQATIDCKSVTRMGR